MANNMLKGSKTPAIIVTEIKMMSSTFKGVHFLVEGDGDSKFWKTRLTKHYTSIVSCEGKQNLLGASQLISRQGLAFVVGVYDADFEHLFGVVHNPHLLTPTDENDLEVTLLASEALDVVLHEYADESLLNFFESNHRISVVDHLEAMSGEFGKLRLLSNLLGQNVDFGRLSPYRFFSSVDWTLNVGELHSEYARLAGVSVKQLHRDLTASIPDAKRWGLCHGHDTVRILAHGLRSVIGKRQISEQDLAKILRIAYSFKMLEKSRMYSALKILEAKMAVPIFD